MTDSNKAPKDYNADEAFGWTVGFEHGYDTGFLDGAEKGRNAKLIKADESNATLLAKVAELEERCKLLKEDSDNCLEVNAELKEDLKDTANKLSKECAANLQLMEELRDSKLEVKEFLIDLSNHGVDELRDDYIVNKAKALLSGE
jgi:hypothetical protein